MKFYNYFQSIKRGNETIVTFADNAPESLRTAVYEAHRDSLPSDWIFEVCADACADLDDRDVEDFDALTFADCFVMPYTAELYEWASKFCNSLLFAEAADRAGELGSDSSAPIHERIAQIQACAIAQIADRMADLYRAEK